VARSWAEMIERARLDVHWKAMRIDHGQSAAARLD
jgi:hypothetical protein